MKKMNCRNVRREIEEVAAGDLLSSPANDHLKNCAQCETFREERLKLREMLSGLGAVEAPGDFDFRLRARLANEKRGGQPFVMRNLSFGYGSAAVATILVLIGSALMFVSLRTPPNRPLAAGDTKPPSNAVNGSVREQQPGNGGSGLNQVALNPQIRQPGVVETNPTPVTERVPDKKRRSGSREGVASLSNPGSKTRDSGIVQAPVFRSTEAVAADGSSVFPIGASFQSLKVSLDDGSGSSRTISVPSVSFGSQRVLAQGSSPLVASARSDW